MTGISLPTLGGLANLTPITDGDTHNNVGAEFENTGYTCPDDKAAWVIFWAGVWEGGATPSILRLRMLPAAGGTFIEVVSRLPPVRWTPIAMQGTIVLLPGNALVLKANGGGSDTDFGHTWSVLEFDYDEA